MSPQHVDMLNQVTRPQHRALLGYLLSNGRCSTEHLEQALCIRSVTTRISELRGLGVPINTTREMLFNTRGRLHLVTFYELTGEAAQLSLPLNCEGDD